MKKLTYHNTVFTFAILFASIFSLQAQPDFNYHIHLEATNIPGLDGLHSYAFGQQDGKWIFIGGRRDGIHARQPFNAFPQNQNNTTIYVTDPGTATVWTAEVSSLPTSISEQLQSTNMQFYQDGNTLFFMGGYGYSVTADDHMTYPHLTAIDLPQLIDAVINGTDIAGSFAQITDDVFAVTGGVLGKIGQEFLLVGGHRFDGRYNPMNHPTFTQQYTNEIRKFTIATMPELSFGNYSATTDEVNLHRRDYNLMPQIYPDGEFGYTIFSGVFQLNQDIPFLYPVDIRSSGHTPINDFNQLLSNYHSASVPLYDSVHNVMHNLFFGGISQYFYVDKTLVQDNDIPFVKTISRVSRASDGTLTEVPFAEMMPAFVGAGAEFLLNEELAMAAPEILDMNAFAGDSILIGHIFGGIESAHPHPFDTNDHESTFASNTIFRVYLVSGGNTTATHLPLSGYHEFRVEIFPNPSNAETSMVKMHAPEPGAIDLILTDVQGKVVLNNTLAGLEEGENMMELVVSEQPPGVYFLTLVLNGKYYASERVLVK